MAEITESQKINLALEIMSDREIEIYQAVEEIIETQSVGVYEALNIYYEEHTVNNNGA